MIQRRSIHIRLPLFLRVVTLYVAVGLPLAATHMLQPADQPVAAVLIDTKPALTIEPSDRWQGEPVAITVPRFDIDLPVIDGTYSQARDSWTLSDTKAQFATMTALPNNETGNTFIYGHNTVHVFAPLAWLQKEDIVRVRTANDLVFQYRYTGTKIVNPETTSILKASGPPRLTLMTCDGMFNQHRRVMFFDFERVV